MASKKSTQERFKEKQIMESIERNYKKVEFIKNPENWHKRVSQTGKTYEIREVPRENIKKQQKESLILQGNG
jgi:hypothetical protein